MSEVAEPLDLRLVPAAASAWATAAWVTAQPEPRAIRVASAVLGLALLAVVVARRRGSPNGGLLLVVVAVAAVLASGAAQTAAERRGGLPLLVEDGAVVTVTGVLRTDAEPSPPPWDPSSARARYVVGVGTVTGRGATRSTTARLLVTDPEPAGGLVRGAAVRVTGRLGAVEAGGASVVGGLAAGRVELLRSAHGADAVVAGLRAGLLEASDALAAPARGLVPGMTVGDTSRVPAEIRRAMRDVGLTHLTAVSGTHVAVVVLAVGALAAALRAPRVLRASVLAVAVVAFVLLVHPEPSVLRASLMGLVGVSGLVVGRRSRAVPALAAVVLVLLAVDPSLVRSVGFTLSVVATAAIVLLAAPAAGLLGALPARLGHAVTVPLAAQSACGPVLVLLDPAVSLWAVPANVAAAPAVLPATVLGLLATAAQPVAPAAAEVLARGAGLATGWISTVACTGADLPGARLGWTPGVPGAVGLGALTALVWLLSARGVVWWRGRGSRTRRRARPGPPGACPRRRD